MLRSHTGKAGSREILIEAFSSALSDRTEVALSEMSKQISDLDRDQTEQSSALRSQLADVVAPLRELVLVSDIKKEIRQGQQDEML